MALTKSQVREHLIKAGIKNLNEFGYPNVTEQNMLTDFVYAKMFQSMLKENLGQSNMIVDMAIEELLKEIETTHKDNRL